MRICVFCSAQDISDTYAKPAQEFAALIGEKSHTLVWGGSNRGLMKQVADAAQGNGAPIIGISMELLRDRARLNADEMIIARDLGERKALMIERSDAFAMMTGGIGTLDELMGVIELKQQHVHDKPIVVLDIGEYYRGLKTQFERMSVEGTLKRPIEESVYFATTPEDAMRYIEHHGN